MLRAPTESLPQRLIVTLLADYRAVLGQPVPSRVLVDLLREFDVGTEAARSALSRLTARGLLERIKHGRETSYVFSEQGRFFVDEDQKRILEFGQPSEWDEMWTMVAFSIAEDHRNKRYAIKTRLRALGFAPLYDGVWIAAFASPRDVQDALDESEVEDADIFRATFVGLSARIGSLHEKWETDELRADYEEFIRFFGPLADPAGSSLPPAQAFIARTRLMDAWRTFPRREPDLPPEHLPAAWPMPRARAIFEAAHTSLQPAAEARLRDLVET